MTAPNLKKIPTGMLTLGMFIEEFCGSWMEHPFWRSRFLLKDEKDLQRIRASSITELWIDTGKGCDVTAEQEAQRPADEEVALEALVAPEVEPVAASMAPVASSMADELARAARICDKSRQAVEQMFSEARMGKAVDAEHCRAMVLEISDSVSRNPGALISLARLKNADEYTYMHSVAVCALMIALAKALGLAEPRVQVAGLAGLLHDMGKALIPLAILNKPGKLSDDEFAIIKEHPARGVGLLTADANPDVLDACLHHHEKTDGSGYPHGLRDADISQLAKMTAVCDVYDAITSNRPYKRGWDPAESLSKMAAWSKGHFDAHIFQSFVKSLGIYPVGSLVRLKSRRLALVVEQRPGQLLKPSVKAFYALDRQARIAPVLLDLAEPGCQDAIEAREAPENWPFKDLDSLWMP